MYVHSLFRLSSPFLKCVSTKGIPLCNAECVCACVCECVCESVCVQCAVGNTCVLRVVHMCLRELWTIQHHVTLGYPDTHHITLDCPDTTSRHS